MSLAVRPAGPTDAERLAALCQALNRDLEEPVNRATATDLRRHGFGQKPGFEAMIAELDGGAVGYVLYHDSFESSFAERGLYLADLYVVPSARRHGVARALIAAVAREARRRDGSFLWWVSKPWNREAQDVYRTLGASEEPVLAHALTGEAFEALAAMPGDPPSGHPA